MDDSLQTNCKSKPWNKGRLIGQKLPLKLREIWQIRANLEHERNVRELAMFDLAIDSKLRACDLMALRVRDVMRGDQISGRSVVLQHKTLRPVRFEITDLARQALDAWIRYTHLQTDDFLFPSNSCDLLLILRSRVWSRSSFRITRSGSTKFARISLSDYGRLGCGNKRQAWRTA